MIPIRTIDLDEGFVSSGIDNGLLYYSADYGRFLRSLLGAESHYLISGSPNSPSALFPAFTTDGPHGRVMNALPFFGSHGAPIVARDSPVGVVDLFHHVEAAIREGAWDSVTIVENPLSPLSDDELSSLSFLKPVDDRISQITHWDMAPPDSLELLMECFHGKMRNAIRKGAATGQAVVHGDSDGEWRFLIEQHQRSITSLGGLAKGQKVFEDLRRIFGERLRLHCGYVGDALVAALLTIRYGSTIEYFVPVVDPIHRDQQVLPHLIAEVMLSDFRHGARAWNWGGTWRSQGGVMQFKSRFGATNRPYRYLNWCHSRIERSNPEQLRASYKYWYVRRFT